MKCLTARRRHARFKTRLPAAFGQNIWQNISSKTARVTGTGSKQLLGLTLFFCKRHGASPMALTLSFALCRLRPTTFNRKGSEPKERLRPGNREVVEPRVSPWDRPD